MTPQLTPPAGHGAFDAPRLRQLLSDHSPLPLLAAEGPRHVVRYANPAFARLWGEPAARLLGRPFAEALPEAAADGCVELLDRVLGTGTPEALAELEHRTPGPRPGYRSYAAWPAPGPDGRPAGVVVQVTDSTEAALFRRQSVAVNEALVRSSVRQHELIAALQEAEQARRGLEAQMLHAQKLESLGVLAGGIAHDLNNILTPVLGFAELARSALPDDAPAAGLLDDVSANARRAADLVQQILAYAGKGRFVVEPVDLAALVAGMKGLLAAAVGSRAELHYELDSRLPPVEADAAQLRQVVMNLVTNAAEAIGGGGTITVRARPAPVGEGALWSPYLKADLPGGAYAALEVADTGHGMTPEVAEKVCDPFFTTKFTGRGLGLAAVQGIAHAHRGVLEIESEPGRGSTFRLLVPCAAGAAPPPPAARPRTAGAGPGRCWWSTTSGPCARSRRASCARPASPCWPPRTAATASTCSAPTGPRSTPCSST